MNLHGLLNRVQLPRCSVPKEQQGNQPETKTVDIETQCENPLTQTKNCFRKPSSQPFPRNHPPFHRDCIIPAQWPYNALLQTGTSSTMPLLCGMLLQHQNNNSTYAEQRQTASLQNNAVNHCSNPKIDLQKPSSPIAKL